MNYKAIISSVFFFWQILSFAQNDSLISSIDSLILDRNKVNGGILDLITNPQDTTISGGGGIYTFIEKKSKKLLKGIYEFETYFKDGTSELIKVHCYYQNNILFYAHLNKSYYQNDSILIQRQTFELDLRLKNKKFLDELAEKQLELIMRHSESMLEHHNDLITRNSWLFEN